MKTSPFPTNLLARKIPGLLDRDRMKWVKSTNDFGFWQRSELKLSTSSLLKDKDSLKQGQLQKLGESMLKKTNQIFRLAIQNC